MNSQTLEWLMQADPAIRWQVMRDLLDAPQESIARERARIATDGWGAALLLHQKKDGNWGSGIYNPKWTSTTYTLLLLRHFGLSPSHPQALFACERFYDHGLYIDGGINLFKSLDYSEICINGMILSLTCYFGYQDQRIHNIANFLLQNQMADGGWNCKAPQGATHSSFHTTISVLEGLFEYRAAYPQFISGTQHSLDRAHEFLLQHHLYQSHHTGLPAHPDMTRMFFPPRWHYDFLRALDYFQSINAPRDQRFNPAINLLLAKQTDDGRWNLNKPWSGKVYFPLENTGEPSRWNSLRAMRVLKWWYAQDQVNKNPK